jgi:uncharacterized protein (DUF427 family)
MAEIPDWAKKHREGWKNRGDKRPEFAVNPKEGQESVWDYPRPPAIVQDKRHIVVKHGDTIIADSRSAVRILETASAPTFYIPPEDVNIDMLVPYSGSSFCEWKGESAYWSVQINEVIVQAAAWSYPDPFEDFAAIKNYLSFYPSRLECYVDGEEARPQPGGFYGGWITDEIVGPVKGEPGVTDF